MVEIIVQVIFQAVGFLALYLAKIPFSYNSTTVLVVIILIGSVGLVVGSLIAWLLRKRPLPASSAPAPTQSLVEPSKTAIMVDGKSYDLPIHFRQEVPLQSKFWRLAKHELWLMAIGFHSISDQPQILEDLLQNNENLRVKFLVANPQNKALMALYEQTAGYAGTKDTVELALKAVCSLKKAYGERVEIKTADFVIFHSTQIVDADFDNGLAHVGFYFFNTIGDWRPTNLIPKSQEDAFKVAVRSFKWAWSNSIEYKSCNSKNEEPKESSTFSVRVG